MDCFKTMPNNSLVRVFHAAPQAPAVDIYTNGILTFSNVSYKDFTKYNYLLSGTHTIDLYVTGTTETPVLSQILQIPTEEMFTLSITGNLDNLSILPIQESIDEEPSNEYSVVRVAHLSPDAPAVDITINGDVLFTDIEFREVSDYVDVNVGSYNISVVDSSNGDIALQLSVQLNADRIYTIYIIGDPPNLGAIQSVDGNTYACR